MGAPYAIASFVNLIIWLVYIYNAMCMYMTTIMYLSLVLFSTKLLSGKLTTVFFLIAGVNFLVGSEYLENRGKNCYMVEHKE